MRSPCTPFTRSLLSTTASPSLPMRQVTKKIEVSELQDFDPVEYLNSD